jgi:hypothetical protein
MTSGESVRSASVTQKRCAPNLPFLNCTRLTTRFFSKGSSSWIDFRLRWPERTDAGKVFSMSAACPGTPMTAAEKSMTSVYVSLDLVSASRSALTVETTIPLERGCVKGIQSHNAGVSTVGVGSTITVERILRICGIVRRSLSARWLLLTRNKDHALIDGWTPLVKGVGFALCNNWRVRRFQLRSGDRWD